jgi:Zn-dependent peptidase ImmA (M78 family)
VKLAPVNPAVLAWAMDEAGMGVRDLAERSKVPEQRVSAFLHGDDQPKTTEFRALAKSLNRSLAFFFLSEPPKKSLLSASFRYPTGNHGRRELTSDEQDALRDSARWQKIISWVRLQEEVDLNLPPLVAENFKPQVAADRITSWLGWEFHEQRKASSASAVLKLLRGRLESRGVLLLQYNLPPDALRGFSIPHQQAPVIALNSRYNFEARVFTVLHELAHLVRGERAVCGQVRDDKLERWCERVAATALIPAGDLKAYLDRWVTTGDVGDIDDVRKVANRYKVSLRAAAIRLREIGRALPGLYGQIGQNADFEKSGFNPNGETQTTPVIRIRELGEEVPRQLLRARDDGLLSETQVRRYLHVNGDQLSVLALRLQTASAED